MSFHLNKMRFELDPTKKSIPIIAYRIFKKKLQEPMNDEGFNEIIKIPFIPYITETNASAFLKHYDIK